MATKTKIVQPGGLNKRLIGTIKAAVNSSAIAPTCDWLVSEGYPLKRRRAAGAGELAGLLSHTDIEIYFRHWVDGFIDIEIRFYSRKALTPYRSPN